MDFIQPQHRLQVTFGSLEEAVEADNPVRLFDAFTEQLDLIRLGFVVRELKSEGRPAFVSRVLLRLYFYGKSTNTFLEQSNENGVTTTPISSALKR
jgi:hypothetical protein